MHRRAFLTLAATTIPFRALAVSPNTVRIGQALPGTAGAIWKPMISSVTGDKIGDNTLKWIGSDPGMAEIHVISGVVDIGSFGVLTATRAVAKGADVVIFGPGTTNHARWIVRGDSKFRKPSDLIGARLSVPPETSEAFQQTDMVARLHGIDMKHEMKLIHSAPNIAAALLARGDVDGAVVLEPLATRLIVNGAREVGRVSDMWREKKGGTLTLVGMAAKRSWVRENLPLAKQVSAIQQQMNAELRRHPTRIAEMHTALGIKDEERTVIDQLPKRLADVYQSEWDSVVSTALDAELATAVTAGFIKSTLTKAPAIVFS